MNVKLILLLSISHVFVDLTGTALPAIMPFLKKALALNYTEVGVVIMASNLTSSIIQPAFGYMSDRVGIKWLLPVSVFLTYAGFSLVGVAPAYWLLLLFVMIGGFGIACYHPESFKMMHFFTGSKKATGMSIFQVGGNLGLALGPLVIMFAIQLADLPGTLLLLVLGLPTVAAMIYFNNQLTLPLKQHAAHPPPAEAEPPSSEGQACVRRSMAALVIAVALRSIAHMGLVTFVPFYYINVLCGDPLTAGRLVFVFLMGGVVGTLIGGIIAGRIGHKRYFGLSMLLAIPLLFLFTHVRGLWVFVVLFIVGLILISSFSVTVVMGQKILTNRLGMASGLMMGFTIGIGGVGTGLLGLVADVWGVLAVLRLISIMPAVGLLPILWIRE